MTRRRRNPAGDEAKLRKTCEALTLIQTQIRSAAPQNYSRVVDLIMSDSALAHVVWGDALTNIIENILDSSPFTETQLDRLLPLLYHRISRVEVLLGIWDIYARSVFDTKTPITNVQKRLLSWSVRSLNRLGSDPTRGAVALIKPIARDTPQIIEKAMQPIGQGQNLKDTLLEGLYFETSGEVIRKAIVEAT